MVHLIELVCRACRITSHSLMQSLQKVLTRTDKKDAVAEAATRLAGPGGYSDGSEVIHRRGQYSQRYTLPPDRHWLQLPCSQQLAARNTANGLHRLLRCSLATLSQAVTTLIQLHDPLRLMTCLQVARPICSAHTACTSNNTSKSLRERDTGAYWLLARHVCR